jgi:hypothetical protein
MGYKIFGTPDDLRSYDIGVAQVITRVAEFGWHQNEQTRFKSGRYSFANKTVHEPSGRVWTEPGYRFHVPNRKDRFLPLIKLGNEKGQPRAKGF